MSTTIAQKAPVPIPIPITPRMRRRAGVQQITSSLMHLVQSRHSLTTTLERNPMADTAMLLTSLLAPINLCLDTVLRDCRSRGYPEVDEIYESVVASVHETHERRSQNARYHQENNKRKREQYERDAQLNTSTNSAPTTRPIVSGKSPRSALHQKYTGETQEPSI